MSSVLLYVKLAAEVVVVLVRVVVVVAAAVIVVVVAMALILVQVARVKAAAGGEVVWWILTILSLFENLHPQSTPPPFHLMLFTFAGVPTLKEGMTTGCNEALAPALLLLLLLRT